MSSPSRPIPRVVVTGMGAVTPAGPTAAATYARVSEGRGCTDTDLTAPVTDFDPSTVLDPREARRVDRRGNDLPGDGLVQPLLRSVPVLPRHSLEPSHTRLEQRLAFRIDGVALFGPNDERPHAIAADAAFIREGVAVNQLHQAKELIGLALVRRSRQQQ